MASVQLFACQDRVISILAKPKNTVWLEIIFYWIFYFVAYRRRVSLNFTILF